MKHAILSLLVVNHFGVLNKVTGLFSRRGYNIKALSVGETEDPAFSRITVLAHGDEQKLEQICSQVSKLEDVKKAELLTRGALIERELALIKVRADTGAVGRLMQIVSDYSAKCTDAGPCVIVEISDAPRTIDNLIGMLWDFGIIELSRTGSTALGLTGDSLAGPR